MISAVSEATVPKLSVIVRKAYGAGLYAMAGPAFDSDCVIALPSAEIARSWDSRPLSTRCSSSSLRELPENERAARRSGSKFDAARTSDLYKLAANPGCRQSRSS